MHQKECNEKAEEKLDEIKIVSEEVVESSGVMSKECNDNVPQERYGVLNKEKDIDENTITPEEIVEYPIVETKVVVTNNTTVKRKCFKITEKEFNLNSPKQLQEITGRKDEPRLYRNQYLSIFQ